MNPSRRQILDALIGERYGEPIRDFGPVEGPQLDHMLLEEEARLAVAEAEEAGRLLEVRRQQKFDADVDRRVAGAKEALR
jgi:hypothetical protein